MVSFLAAIWMLRPARARSDSTAALSAVQPTLSGVVADRAADELHVVLDPERTLGLVHSKRGLGFKASSRSERIHVEGLAVAFRVSCADQRARALRFASRIIAARRAPNDVEVLPLKSSLHRTNSKRSYASVTCSIRSRRFRCPSLGQRTSLARLA